jgi:large repetitive protein
MRRLLAALLAVGALALVPAAPAVAQAPGCEVGAGSLTWGFKESFRAYIDGSIANGEWTVADGATYDTPSFGFTAGDGRLDPRGPLGAVDFPGSVRFTGHDGVLDTTIADPVLQFRGDGKAFLLLDVRGVTMDGDEIAMSVSRFVELDLSGQDLELVDGILTLDEAPATLTADGALAFPNYPEGEAFDPVSATIDVGADCDLSGLPIGGDAYDPPPANDLVSVVVGGAVIALLAVILLVFARRRRRR